MCPNINNTKIPCIFYFSPSIHGHWIQKFQFHVNTKHHINTWILCKHNKVQTLEFMCRPSSKQCATLELLLIWRSKFKEIIRMHKLLKRLRTMTMKNHAWDFQITIRWNAQLTSAQVVQCTFRVLELVKIQGGPL